MLMTTTSIFAPTVIGVRQKFIQMSSNDATNINALAGRFLVRASAVTDAVDPAAQKGPILAPIASLALPQGKVAHQPV